MHNPDTYLTIERKSRGVYRDRGSRFLAFAFPVRSVEEIRSILGELRKQYHDARHHCYAYRLGAAKREYRANDDGEPSGSAGKPILGQIRALDLSNVLVVVVRYFGGTLLGVGGLIQAYRSAAADALNKARIIEAEETDTILVSYPYALTSDVMKIVGEEGIRILEQDFTETCSLRGQVRKGRKEVAMERLNKLPGVSAGASDP
jgi:uncharacterized YigZ family protein